MKRRIIVITVIVVILGGLGAGVWWYIRQTTGPRRLARAELAIRAGKFQKALDLATGYAASHPDNWRGHYAVGRALIHLDRLTEARVALARAGRLKPSEASVRVAMAESYSLPARKSLARKDALRRPDLLKKAIEQFGRANEILLKIRTADPKWALEVPERAGLNHRSAGVAWRGLSDALAEEATVAEASRNPELSAAKRKASEEASAKSKEADEEAIRVLLEVVREEASRRVAARTLVDLCIQQKDEKSLAAARRAILALKSPPPVAAMNLALYEVTREPDLAARRERTRELCKKLDKLLQEHPKEEELKLVRAGAAATLGDTATAERLCGEILKANRRQPRARLIRGSVLMQQGKLAEAEGVLFALRRDNPGWAEAHYRYAQAAAATGRKERAREAMRAVTRLVPDHPGARAYLAESLLGDGFHDQAFTDAEAYYEGHPDDPVAVSLFARVATLTDRPDLARKAVEKAAMDFPTSPEMLLAAADGYRLLRERENAQQALRKATGCKPASLAGRLAVARAMRRLGRNSEAEKRLIDELARDPSQPVVCFRLGQLYAATGRWLQATERFRAASRMAPGNVDYRLALAETLYHLGDLAQSEDVLRHVEATNPAANLLRMQVKLLRGQPVTAEQMLQLSSAAGRTGLPLALTYLNSDQPQRCVEACLAGLKKKPDDRSLRFLLGRAYLVLGKRDDCIAQWSEVVKAAPQSLPAYQTIARVLAGSLDPKEVRKALAKIPNARAELVDMAMGWLLWRRGDFDAAARTYAAVADKPAVSEFYRNRARLLAARALAAKGEIDQAQAELGKLRGQKHWEKVVTGTKADILVAAGRPEAAAALDELRKIAIAEKDGLALQRIARAYAGMGKTQEALTVCGQAAAMFPEDANPCLLRAAILSRAGRRTEALPALRKAAELQPGNFNTYVNLAKALEAENQPRQALGALDRLAERGEAGRAYAWFERGQMFARLGLHAQARQIFQELMAQGHQAPALRLALGRALAALGQSPQARQVLGGIPGHSPQHAPAQRLLAAIAATDTEKLKILEGLEQARPNDASVVAQKMNVLLAAERPAEAAKAFRAFVERSRGTPRMPPVVAFRLVGNLLAAGDRAAAAEVAAQTATLTRLPRWRQMAALLKLDARPDEATRLLPSMNQADTYDALLGLIASVQKAETASVHKWAGRLDQIDQQLGQLPTPLGVPPSLKFLAALAAGRMQQGRSMLASAKGPGGNIRRAGEELIGSAGAEGEISGEAARLLKASLGVGFRLPVLARSWAMESLKARPKCQWAATVILQTNPDTATYRQVLAVLQPSDCVLAQRVQALLLTKERKYKEAAEVFRRAAQVEKDDLELLLEQAMSLERAGQLTEAFALYLKAWRSSQSQVAANNAAYLVTQLFPKDAPRLREALGWMEATVKGAPPAAFFDTKGWIEFLLGQKQEALADLRRAVRGLPDSAEVHYHLGMAEAEVGDREFSEWHLAAAVSCAEAARAKSQGLRPAEANAAKLAKAALGKMNRKPE